MRINWKIRLQNKAFWVAAIPALLLFKNGQPAARTVGYQSAAALEGWLRENGAL